MAHMICLMIGMIVLGCLAVLIWDLIRANSSYPYNLFSLIVLLLLFIFNMLGGL